MIFMIFCGAGDERFWTPYQYLKPWVPPLPMAFILAPRRWRWRRRERLRRVSEPRPLLLCSKTMGAGGRWEGRRPIHSWVVPELPVSMSRGRQGRATGGALSSRRQGGACDPMPSGRGETFSRFMRFLRVGVAGLGGGYGYQFWLLKWFGEDQTHCNSCKQYDIFLVGPQFYRFDS
jgi:hypothetical protein